MTGKNFGRGDLMAIAAFRYCLGRKSYIVEDCGDWLIQQWDEIRPNAQHVIERDLREAIQRDDEHRRNWAGTDHAPLGMDMDRAVWLNVLAMIEAHKAPAGAAGG